MALTLQTKYRLGILKWVRSPESISKVAEALRGRHLSEETRQKIGNGLQRAWKEGRLQKAPPKGPTVAEERLRKVIEPLGFLYQMKIKTGKRGIGGALYYTPDFTHPKFQLCVEVDGRCHWESVRIREKDRRVEAFLQSINFRLLRFTNDDVISRLDSVLQKIMAAVTPPP